ncbi:MAG: hypothetical protein J6J12_07355 [Oscillospiraceae bacterium]|nr:hypothetical protein [Oscillospiraceae bacterium]
MMRHVWRLAIVSAMIIVLVLTASAAQTGCSIWVKLDVGELPVTNGAFTLYYVGVPISDGYRIGEEFGGGFVRGEDALSPHLAQWLNGMGEKQGSTVLLDVDGIAVFSSLQEGLYLLSQTERTDGFYPIQPFLVSVPGSGKQNVSLYLEPLPMVADSPPTGQDPTPYIGAVGLVLSLAGMALCTRGRKRW